MAGDTGPGGAGRPPVAGPAVPVLTDGVVRLRGFRPGDAAAHLAAEDEVTVRFLSGGRSSLAGTRSWIAGQAAAWAAGGPALVLAVEDLAATRAPAAADGGKLAGMVEARFDLGAADGVPPGTANLSYGLHPWARGRGLATRAVRLLLAELERRGTPTAVIRCEPANATSAAVADRLGFRRAAPVTDGSGREVLVFRSPGPR